VSFCKLVSGYEDQVENKCRFPLKQTSRLVFGGSVLIFVWKSEVTDFVGNTSCLGVAWNIVMAVHRKLAEQCSRSCICTDKCKQLQLQLEFTVSEFPSSQKLINFFP